MCAAELVLGRVAQCLFMFVWFSFLFVCFLLRSMGGFGECSIKLKFLLQTFSSFLNLRILIMRNSGGKHP